MEGDEDAGEASVNTAIVCVCNVFDAAFGGYVGEAGDAAAVVGDCETGEAASCSEVGETSVLRRRE